MEERLQVLLTDSQEEVAIRSSPGQHSQRYPGREEEEELQPGYPGDDRVPHYQRYPVEEDREEESYRPHQRYPVLMDDDLGEAGQLEDRKREMPGLQSLGELEHEVKTQEGMNVNLNCVAIGSLPEDAVADWSREDGREIDGRHKADTDTH